MNIDLGMLNPQEPGDPVLSNESLFLVYANLGMAITYRDFFAGVSVNDIAITNDYAIVIGDDLEPTESVVFGSGVNRNAIALTRNCRLKQAKLEAGLKATFAAASATDIANLIRVLATQGILVGGSLTAIAP